MDDVVARHVLEARTFEDAVSEVWRARHRDRPTQRATVRIVDLSRDPHLAPAVEPFLNDARVASDLVHRNIVQAYATGDGARPYVLSRHTPAVAWAAYVREGGGTTAAIALLAPLATALDTAAAAGVAHGAVHPRTILVDEAGTRAGARRSWLTGFGVHHLLSVVAARRSGCRSVADFLYVAPELLRGAGPTNHSDQYSLAAALQHALTGRPPFAGEHLPALFGSHLFGRRPPLPDDLFDGGSVAELDRVLQRALAKDPDERFASCEEFIAAVVECHAAATGKRMAGVGALATRPDPTPLPVALAAHTRPARRAPRTMALAAAGIAIGLLAAGWLARETSSADSSKLVAAQREPIAHVASEAPPVDRSVRWRRELPSAVTGLHLTAEGTVAATSDGAVLLAAETGEVNTVLSGAGPAAAVTDDRVVTTHDGGLRAVSVVDGMEVWNAPVQTAAPAVAGDTVYGVTGADVPQLVATDSASGDRLWEFPQDEAAFPADSAVAANDDFVYVAERSALYGILPTGAMPGADTPLITASEAASEPLCLWRHEVEEDMWPASLQAVDGGVVVAHRSGDVCLRGHVDGAPQWCVRVRGVSRTAPTIHTTDGRVIVASRSAVTAIDMATGTTLWMHTGSWRRTVMAGEKLVAVDDDGQITMFSVASGTQTRSIDTTVGRPSALAADGETLYVGRRDGMVLSIDLTAGAAS